MLHDPNIHYLDNAATTMVNPEVIETITKAMAEHWANPSSLYTPGAHSELALNKARADVARTLGATAGEVYFTGCGSEGNNLAILGAARTRKWGKRIVCTGFEHPSVALPMQRLAQEGYDVQFVAPEADGHLNVDKMLELVDKNTILVAAMQVNDLTFTCTDGIWTLADDPDYALTQSSVRKMAGTILEMQTAWTITAPEADSAYGLDAPDVTATLSFTDGTSLTVRFGTASASDDSLCYLASSDAPTLVYEVNADHKSAFAVTKESLHDDTATAETAADTDVVAQYPVGGENDYADSLPD